MESDLGEVRQDINKVLQMINDKAAEWVLQSATISTAEWRTHARSSSDCKESYSSTLNKFYKSYQSQIKVFTGAFFCWVPILFVAPCCSQSNWESIQLIDLVLIQSSPHCSVFVSCFSLLHTVQMQRARPSRNASPNLRSSSEEVRRR